MSRLGKKGWDDVLIETYHPSRFIDWVAMCHADPDIGHCGMCVDCVFKPRLEQAA